jgi:hypothetical protein
MCQNRGGSSFVASVTDLSAWRKGVRGREDAVLEVTFRSLSANRTNTGTVVPRMNM